MPGRRQLNVPRVLVTGALLGFVVGAVIGVRPPHLPGYSLATEAGFLGVVGALAGLLLAGIVVALVDRGR